MAMSADRWLNSDECADHFGLRHTKAGKPNRRGFLERFAALPGFPRPLVLPNCTEKRWKLSELEDWADEQRRASRAA
jgi:hypothetical protein